MAPRESGCIIAWKIYNAGTSIAGIPVPLHRRSREIRSRMSQKAMADFSATLIHWSTLPQARDLAAHAAHGDWPVLLEAVLRRSPLDPEGAKLLRALVRLSVRMIDHPELHRLLVNNDRVLDEHFHELAKFPRMRPELVDRVADRAFAYSHEATLERLLNARYDPTADGWRAIEAAFTRPADVRRILEFRNRMAALQLSDSMRALAAEVTRGRPGAPAQLAGL